MWFKYVSNNLWRDFKLSTSASAMVTYDTKSKNHFFAVNLLLKLFSATVANANIGSLKSLHTFLYKCLYHLLVKFEQNRMGQKYTHFSVF